MAPSPLEDLLRKGDVEEEADEEDYMSMTFSSESTNALPSPSYGPGIGRGQSGSTETSLQRRARLKKEGEVRGRMKSKAELAAEEKEKREERMSRSLLEDPRARKSKAFKMMERMGFKADVATRDEEETGGACVADGEERGTARVEDQNKNPVSGGDEARREKEEEEGKKEGRPAKMGRDEKKRPGLQHTAEPIRIQIKDNRSGIGHETAEKRKLAERISSWPVPGSKKAKVMDEGEFRDRVRRERETARNERLVRAAQNVAEKLHGEATGTEVSEVSSRPLKSIPVLWRTLGKEREERTRSRRAEKLDASLSAVPSLSRLPKFRDKDEYDEDDMHALGKSTVAYDLSEDLDEEDEELDGFEALDPAEKLEKLVGFLRVEFRYCFWCKCGYEDDEMEACPGVTEEGHD